MRLNAIVAAYILVATVSGVALPITDDTAAEIAAPTKQEASGKGCYVPEDFPEDSNPEDYEFILQDNAKHSAGPNTTPEAGRTWNPWRPTGLGRDKRDAEVKAGLVRRPWRPTGLGAGKREAMPEAEAQPEAGWTWRPWRPTGISVGKRDAVSEAKWSWRPWRPTGIGAGKREVKLET